jgi:REP element-mobilizing transposase RayT
MVMESREIFEEGGIYHIYNHGNGFENIFRSNNNYHHFLRKHDEYMVDVWECLAFCLMPNHFHLLVRIKESNCQNDSREDITKKVSRQYSHFTNSYVQSFNKNWGRKGSLFIRSFKRKRVLDEIYMKNLVCYIHNNPVKHGFKNATDKWEFSSYNRIINSPEEKLNKEVIELFGDFENFVAVHRYIIDGEII